VGQPNEMREGQPTIVIAANSFWNIANFRGGLIRALIQQGYRTIIAAPDADAAWAQDIGAEAVAVAVDRSGLDPLSDARTLLAYWKLIRRTRPAVFVAFTVKPNIYGLIAAQLTGVPALPNVSGLGTAFIQGGLLSWFVTRLYRLALRGAKIIFFQNPDDRDLFVERSIITPGQARLLPGSGIDLTRFAPTEQPSGAPVFLLVGRMLGDKGIREFVEAARVLKAKHPAWRFQLLGPRDEGNRSSIGRDEVDRWMREGAIEYLGEADDVRPHISKASAVVLPSYREGLPRSLLEGAAMARPLVATDVPGNRHLVDHGVNGLLCEARSAAALAGAMEQIGAMTVGRRAEMGAAARARVEREFDEELVIRAYLDAIRQLRQDADG
jgi:glycosyltransferase involved in cell wall biosynthesis